MARPAALARIAFIASVVVAIGCEQATGPDGLAVDNGTTFAVSLVVNGSTVTTVAPQTEIPKIPLAELPPLPWSVMVVGTDGRTLLWLDVDSAEWAAKTADEVPVTGQSTSGAFTCGDLEVWSGVRPDGPSIGPGDTRLPDPLCEP
jgi:sugar lactone lactonase YvrE